MPVPSRASARLSGDLDRITDGDTGCCLTYAPEAGTRALQLLADAPSDWRGLVRIVPDDWGGEAALLPWLVDDVAVTLAAVRRALLVDLGPGLAPWQGLFRLASTFTTLAVIVGASPTTPLRLAHALCRTCPNVLLESSNLGGEALRHAVDALGERRVVFGSDAPRQSVEDAMARVAAAGLSGPEQRRVLRENAEELITGHWRP